MIRARMTAAAGLAAGLCALVMVAAGCRSTNRADDGSYDGDVAPLLAQEVADMGEVAGEMLSEGPARQASAGADTVQGELTIKRFAYEASCGCWVREAVLTLDTDYERTRLDTITFRDAQGGTQQFPTPATTRTIEHVRHATHDWSGGTADVRFEVTTDVSTDGGDTTLVRNGSLEGSVNGVSVATAEIDGVTARRYGGRWHFPESGSVTAEFPVFTYAIVYEGDNQASVLITNTNTDRTWSITVTVLDC